MYTLYLVRCCKYNGCEAVDKNGRPTCSIIDCMDKDRLTQVAVVERQDEMNG